jgi:fumarate reductase subunit C
LDNSVIEGVIGRQIDGRKSKIPARLDFIQSASGLFLALFMWGHMFFVSSILVSKEFMYEITGLFELKFLFDGGSPVVVILAVAVVSFAFIAHAFVAVRKFPKKYRQYRAFRSHMAMMKHTDTNIWFLQAITGFALFFLGSVHLYIVFVNPMDIGPYASADRIWSEMMWPLYILLLLAVEFHGTIGLYRLIIKWGWFLGKNEKKNRFRLKIVFGAILMYLIVHGTMTLWAYMKIGMELQENGKSGTRFHPVEKVEEMK